jgi:hypothetical protein
MIANRLVRLIVSKNACAASLAARASSRSAGASMVGPRLLDLAQAGRLHRVSGDEGLGLLGVDLRPPAAGPAGREPLPPELVVESALLPVDPAEAESGVHRLGVGDGRPGGALLGDPQPGAGRVGIPGQPGREGRRGLEFQEGKVSRHRASLAGPGDSGAAR